MNTIRLTGEFTQKAQMRYTPAGLAVLEVVFHHMSVVKEAGEDRRLVFDFAGKACGDIAEALDVGKSSVQRYLEYMVEQGILARGEYGYESIEQSRTERTVSVAKLGYVPCGPLSEEYECIDGYVRLPVSFVGNAKKCFLLTASGNSMIDAGINDGDLVLVRQQEEANYNDIVVALVDNEVTLKRYRPDNENGVIVLHPENKRMKDIVVDECKIQGVAIKVIKDLEN